MLGGFLLPFFSRKINKSYNEIVIAHDIRKGVKIMKKTLLILGVTYTAVCLGMGIWMICNPEGYGKWIGKYMNGMLSVMTKEEI